MAKKASADDATLRLIEEVQKRKAEIQKLSKPSWITNRSFAYVEGTPNVINIGVERNTTVLVKIAGFLRQQEANYSAAASELDVEVPAFKWDGFSLQDWLSDIKQAIDKLTIKKKQEKLAVLESRLDAIITPELRRQMELEAITAELEAE